MAVTTKPTLKLGDESFLVNGLQTMLNMLGYLETEQITSVFDFPTEHAVKSFQADYGLRIDGIVGEETWAALEAVSSGEWVGPPPLSYIIWTWIKHHKLLSCLIAGGAALGIYFAVKK